MDCRPHRYVIVICTLLCGHVAAFVGERLDEQVWCPEMTAADNWEAKGRMKVKCQIEHPHSLRDIVGQVARRPLLGLLTWHPVMAIATHFKIKHP